MEIIPAILENNWENVKKKIELVDGLVDWLQLDVSDGIFTPNKTWNNPEDLEGLNFKSKIEVHLMVANPLEVLSDWFAKPISRAIVQVESLEDSKPPGFAMGQEVVLGFKIETPWEEYQDMILETGRVLFLSVSPGLQGQTLEAEVFDKIKSLKQAHPRIKIEVDGGINLENIQSVKSAGADTAAVGSGIFGGSDPRKALERIKAALLDY